MVRVFAAVSPNRVRRTFSDAAAHVMPWSFSAPFGVCARMSVSVYELTAMREVMVGRARSLSSPYSGKVCCSAGEVQSQGRTLQDFPFFSAPISAREEQAGARAAKRFHPTSLAGLPSRGRVAEVQQAVSG